jgi:uncharacterized membrane protein YeaQ/YmgE (transglycosylase-associated protein family)
MKNFFSFINLVVGVLSLLVGSAILRSFSQDFGYAGAGFLAVVIAVVCLWLAKESVAHRPKPLI